jgi:uncharacterized protein YdeI (YjbR/CyaY-like superfamily)
MAARASGAPKPSALDALPHVEPASRAQWRSWLAAYHAQATGVWLVTWKKGTDHPTVSYDDAVEEALCFGWVDSKPGKVDAQRTRLLFTPRKPKSVWAATNKARVQKLVAAGRMTPAGQAAIDIAKANGAWDALNEVDALTMPDDLVRALKAQTNAAQHFDAFPPGVRKAILQWIASAKTEPTRAKRVLETATLAARNERANQWRPKVPG